MSKILIFIALVLIFVCRADAQKTVLEKTVNVDFNNVTIEDALQRISKSVKVYFSYQSTLIGSDIKLNFTASNMPLHKVLDIVLEHTDLKYTVFDNQIILQRKMMLKKFHITGSIFDDTTFQPLSYAALQWKNNNEGIIAGIEGNFELTFTEKQLEDTLQVSFLGYESLAIQAKALASLDNYKLYLTPKVYKIPEITVNASDYKTTTLGNHRFFAIGSLYMDTHGQQTALYIPNKKEYCGIIKTVSFYISSKGNLDAPFRVRIYLRDSLTGGPGKDLLKQMVVVKPGVEDGWFTINVEEFHIPIPANGFFVAMEGIFPNDTKNESHENDFVDLSDIGRKPLSSKPTTIIYGQRLGYSLGHGNNTWHYSLSHTWFQLDKDNYNVMISAEIEIKKKQK